MGWKTIFNKPNAWIKYNTVDFGNQKLHAVVVKAMSSTGGTLQIHLDKIQGPLIAQIKVPQTDEWKEIKTPLSSYKSWRSSSRCFTKNQFNC